MIEIVTDASVVMKWLIQEEFSAEARLLLSDPSLIQIDALLIAPDIMLAEIAHGLRRLVNRKVLATSDAEQYFSQFLKSLPIELYGIWGDSNYDPARAMVEDALMLGNQYGCSLYDALYVCLTIKRGAFLVTADRKLYEKPLPLSWTGQLVWIGDIPQWLQQLQLPR